MSMDDRVSDFWEYERDHGWGAVRDEAERLISDLEKCLRDMARERDKLQATLAHERQWARRAYLYGAESAASNQESGPE